MSNYAAWRAVPDSARLGRAELALALFAATIVLLAFIIGVDAIRFHVAGALGADQRPPLSSLGGLLGLLVATVDAVVFARAAKSGLRQLRDHRMLIRQLPTTVDRCGPQGRYFIVDDDRPRAYCAGLLRPRVFVSTGAVSLLDARALAAVLTHEAHHARRRDPLRLLLARTIGDALGFLPSWRKLAEREAALAELAADAAAVRAVGGPAPLAQALLVFEQDGAPVGIGIAPERVDHLLGRCPEKEVPAALLVGAAVLLGALCALALWIVLGGHVDVGMPLALAPFCTLIAVLSAAVIAGPAWAASQRAVQAVQPVG